MSDDSDKGDEKRKTRSDALRGRLSPSSESSKTADAPERSEASETDAEENGESGRDEPESGSDASKNSEASEDSDASESSEASKTDSDSVRDRKNVNMYLPEVLIEEADFARDELNLKMKRAGMPPLEKNRHFRPLLIARGLDSLSDSDLEEIAEELDSDPRLDSLSSEDDDE